VRYFSIMGPKLKPQSAEPIVLTRERLVELMGEETADELLATARGEATESVVMSPEELERWIETGEGPWPDSSD
jgi:hypothetical protein